MIVKLNKEYYDLIFPFIVINKHLINFNIIKLFLSGKSKFNVNFYGNNSNHSKRDLVVLKDIANSIDWTPKCFEDIVELEFDGKNCFSYIIKNNKLYVPLFYKLTNKHAFTILNP